MKAYNYVIFGSGKFFDVAYNELRFYENVVYLSNTSDIIKSSFSKLLYRITFSPHVNKYVSYPFKRATFHALSNVKFENGRRLCFIFFANQHELINNGFIGYLKKRYPSCKVVFYFQDLVKINTKIDVEDLKKQFDLVLSYDKGDCERFGLIYHPTPYSRIEIKSSDKYPKCDVFFCGKAKTRLGTLIQAYKELVNQGQSCLFIITGVPEEEQITLPGIVYNSGITYKENISYEQNARCLLEIMQDDATGFTPRLWEAIMFDKHLLTNNKTVMQSEFYVKEYCHSLDELDNVSSWINKEVKYSHKQKQALSPAHFLEKIETILS